MKNSVFYKLSPHPTHVDNEHSKDHKHVEHTIKACLKATCELPNIEIYICFSIIISSKKKINGEEYSR